MENKITFLFGAGADQMYDIGAGASFIGPLLKANFKEERKKLLGNNSEYKLIYPNSIKVYLQTIASFPEKAKKVMDESIVDKFIKCYQDEEAVPDEVRHQLREWYNLLQKKEDDLNNDEKEVQKFFLENAVFFDTLDERFNSLRTVPLNSKALRVLNAYTTIFILMLTNLYDIPDSFSWKYSDIFDMLKQEYQHVDKERESYYLVLKNSNLDYFITTTNYTNVAEKVTEKEVVYLHGKLNWFEDYRHLLVFDCLEINERKELENNLQTIMPFILIPSGVKPLVCKKEVEQFKKFTDQLQDSKYLCVVGYRFNSEDNHINSIICEWLRNPEKRLLYLNFNSELDWKKLTWAERFNVVETSASPSEGEFVDLLNTKGNIINIHVEKENSLEWFKTLVTHFENSY